MDNIAHYGLRWRPSLNGGVARPVCFPGTVATLASFDVNNGAANVALRKGDPVIRLSTGHFTLCDGNEGAGGALRPWGVVMAVEPYWDGVRMRHTDKLPSDVSYGTNLTRQSKILVAPIRSGLWEMDTDDAGATYDTVAEFQAFVGENVDYKLCGTTGQPYAYPKIDISTHAVTNTLVMRIQGISPNPANQDFTGTGIKLIVSCNLAQEDLILGV